ncbi:MAG: multicopper oxidase domain-containing protein [Kiritimatiellia bacterium]
MMRPTKTWSVNPMAVLLGTLALFVPWAILSAATVEYDLTIARQEINITGHPVQAMTLNGQLPGPTLRFTDGDHATIRVHNQVDVETSIHWHGILLPNNMDSVPFVLLSFIFLFFLYVYYLSQRHREHRE